MKSFLVVLLFISSVDASAQSSVLPKKDAVKGIPTDNFSEELINGFAALVHQKKRTGLTENNIYLNPKSRL